MKDIIVMNNITDDKQETSDHPMRIVLELINYSMNDENLSKMPIPWNPWF